MKYILSLFSLLFSIAVAGQNTDTLDLKNYNFNTLEIIHGQHIYKNQLNNKLNSFNSFKLIRPIQSIGISYSGLFVINSKIEQTMHISYSQVLPQIVHVNDTLKSTIGGYLFSLDLISLNMVPGRKSVNIPLGFGFNTGRLKLKAETYKTQKNPFFAPAFFLNPRFLIKKIALGVRFDYQFDISKAGWRSVIVSKNKNSFSVDDFNQTGFIIHFSIGWNLL